MKCYAARVVLTKIHININIKMHQYKFKVMAKLVEIVGGLKCAIGERC